MRSQVERNVLARPTEALTLRVDARAAVYDRLTKCWVCMREFYSARPTLITCGPTCRKKRQRILQRAKAESDRLTAEVEAKKAAAVLASAKAKKPRPKKAIAKKKKATAKAKKKKA